METDTDGRVSKSIGAGMTPGDDSYGEPYWYVVPWPAPTDMTMAELAGEGRWHMIDWLGAVLPGPRLVAAGVAEAQQERVMIFLQSALGECRLMLKDR